MKKYRFRKITPEMVEAMKELREDGLTYKAIGEKFNIRLSSVQYWLNPLQKEKTIKRSKKFYKKLTKKQKRENEKKHSEYRKKYYFERYNSDEEFRKRHIKNISNSFKKRSNEWKKKGLCSNCGRKRKDKRWKRCERCREKKRKRRDKKRG